MQRFALFARQVHVAGQAPVWFAVGMLIGCVWYFSVNYEPNLWVVSVAFFALLISTRYAKQRFRSALSGVVLILFCGIAAGAASGGLASARVQTVTIMKETGPVRLEGWIQNALPGERGLRLLIRVHAIDGVATSQQPAFVRITHRSQLRTEPGRFVTCWVVLRPPPKPVISEDYAFDLQAWYADLGAVGYVQGRCRGGVIGAPEGLVAVMSHAIAVQRRQLAHHVRNAAGDRAGGFAAALASGDRSFMSIADQDALRGAGLAHLLAISGLHMGIVGGLVFLFVGRGLSLIEPLALRGSVKKPAAAAALLACFAYLVISGASVSTQRAFIMAAVLFGAVLIDRTALSLRSLSIAMILILAMAPWSVLSPGFQMSFAATGALIASYERWQRRRRASAVPRRSQFVFCLQSLVVTSTVSSFATMPFALYHFSRVAGLGLIANLIAMPLVSLISAPSAAAALLLAPVGQDAWALRLFGLSLEAVLAVAHYFSQALPDRTLMFPAMPASCLALFTGAILFFCLLRSARAAWISSTLIAALSVLVWANAGIDRVHWAPSGEVFLEHKSGRVERIELIKGEGLGPLRFADLDVTRKCLAGAPCQMRLGPAQIGYDASAQALEITHALSPSSTVLTWSEVSAENGISVELRGATIRRMEKLACGRRPWRSC